MFDHFGRRLQRDLKHIVDTRIQTSEALSGGLMRVRSLSHLEFSHTQGSFAVHGSQRQRCFAQEAAVRRLVRRSAAGVDARVRGLLPVSHSFKRAGAQR